MRAANFLLTLFLSAAPIGALSASDGRDQIVESIEWHIREGTRALSENTPKAAETSFKAALGLAMAAKNKAAQAGIYNNLGALYLEQDDITRAAASFQDALALLTNEPQHSAALFARINLADLAFRSGDNAEAVKQLQNVLGEISASPPSAAQLLALERGGLLAFARIDPVDAANPDLASIAEAFFRHLLRTADANHDAYRRSLALGHLGLLAKLRAENTKAQNFAAAALLSAGDLNAPELTYRWNHMLARLEAESGDLARAAQFYAAAMADVNKLRSTLDPDDAANGISFQTVLAPIFSEYADILLRRAASATDNDQKSAFLREARYVIETFKTAELEDYFGDPCVTTLERQEVSLDFLAGSHTAALYPVILDDRIELIVTLPGGTLYQAFSTIDRSDLNELIDVFRDLISRPTALEHVLPPAQALYDLIIAPVAERLEASDIDTIVFVPDGALRTIPLSALNRDGTPSGFLAKDYAIAVTPGLTLFDPSPIPRDGMRLLAFGLTDAVQGFSPLPAVKQELTGLTRLYSPDVHMNSEFTQSRVTSVFSRDPFQVVHLATHGQFTEDPENTFLLTYDDKLSLSELEALIGISRFRSKPVELLTLSACQTATGNARAALGLAGIAIKSGARSALATLWFVNDTATAALIQAFYERLAQGSVSKAEALRQAQLMLLRQDQTAHPYFWAPFLMIGNWY